MAISKENALVIKKQLLAQIESLPEENRNKLKGYIESLDEEELEEFLKQNNVKTSQINDEQREEKPLFASIVDREIPSYIIAENKDSLAILEINPLSMGHTIVIPKKQTTVEKLPKLAFSLAQRLSKKIKSKLKPVEIKIETSSFQGYATVNVIPIYKNKPLQKTKAETTDLEKLRSMLEIKSRTKSASPRKPKQTNQIISNSKLKEISFRIP